MPPKFTVLYIVSSSFRILSLSNNRPKIKKKGDAKKGGRRKVWIRNFPPSPFFSEFAILRHMIPKTKLYNYAKVFLLTLYLVLGASSIINKSPTADESLHLGNGIAYHKFKNFTFGIEHPPFLRLLAVLPSYFVSVKTPPENTLVRDDKNDLRVGKWDTKKDIVFARNTLYAMGNRTDTIFFIGRLMILLLGVPLGLILFKWSKILYGEKAAFLTLGLFCMSPNILAHARLVTTDFGSAALSVIASFFLWKFSQNINLKNFVPSAILWAFALSCKFTCIFYFLVFHIMAFIFTKDKRKFILFFLIQLPITAFVINLCYFFTEPVFGNFFLTEELSVLPEFFRPFFAFLAKISFLPRVYLKGVIESMHHAGLGHNTYFFGMYSFKGWWYYFPIAFIIKTTLISLIISSIALFSLQRKKMSRDELFYIIPSVLFLLFMMRSNLNIGIRHIIILWPFVFLFAGRAAILLPRKLLTVILIAALAENLIIFPHYISQFNILFGGTKNCWKYLSDSNMDWGQDLKYLAKWWGKKNKPPLVLSYFGSPPPDYYGIKYQPCMSPPMLNNKNLIFIPENPDRAFFAISVMHLLGVPFKYKHFFSYFREKKPVKICGRSIFVYDITSDAYAHLVFSAVYKLLGDQEFSARELGIALRINPRILERENLNLSLQNKK